MKLIVISSPIAVPNEYEIINSLFENGLEIFQIHKPAFSEEKIKNYIQQIPSEHHNRIFLHYKFPKFHSLEELKRNFPARLNRHLLKNTIINRGTYFFLSPIFDSISKQGYKSKFDLHELKMFLQKQNPLSNGGRRWEVFALGGIDEDKIKICREVGFAGVAVCGAIWKSKNPVEKFLKIKEKCCQKDLMF